MLFLCVNVYCHRVTTQLQLINIIIKPEKRTFLVNYMSYCRTRRRRRGGGYTEYTTALIDRRSNLGRPTRCFYSPKCPEMFPAPNGFLLTGHRSPSPGVKRQNREVKHLRLSRTEVRMSGAISPTSSMPLQRLYGVNLPGCW